jgi:hypothetical protein
MEQAHHTIFLKNSIFLFARFLTQTKYFEKRVFLPFKIGAAVGLLICLAKKRLRPPPLGCPYQRQIFKKFAFLRVNIYHTNLFTT